jgi:GH15 family glucan-1,4-alpha-glucosidase
VAQRPSTRLLAGILISILLAPLSPGVPPAHAQTAACAGASSGTPETFGPTDINAATGNQRLSVGLNRQGTITVFKWPSASYFDQIKYRTTDRREPRFGALPNEGSFLGLAWKAPKGWRFGWLRDWPSRQRMTDHDGDAVLTVFSKRGAGLKVKVSDVVAPYADVLMREVTVKRSRRSPVRRVRVFAFANFNPVVSKLRQNPTNDWCTEEDNDLGARYYARTGLVVHENAGVDESTGDPSTVALGFGFLGRPDGYQVGPDTYQQQTSGRSAYSDAKDAKLSGRDEVTGQADAALFDEFRLGSRPLSTTVVMGAAADLESLEGTMSVARNLGHAATARQKRDWWRAWLGPTRIPRSAPRPIMAVAKRALITLRLNTDPRTGLIARSIATQPPYGLDWVRVGAYLNAALHKAGQDGMVDAHNRAYGSLQATQFQKPPGGEVTPAGNWSENFYSDGVVGGARSYEIDSTGLGIWTLWDHYAKTRDNGYLDTAIIYESIQRAAHYLTDDTPLGCRDPSTGLQCPANEEGSAGLTRTLRGAQAAWLGLRSAVKAALARGGEVAEANAATWQDRAAELRAAIDANMFDPACRCYTSNHEVGGTLLWPVGLVPYDSGRASSQAEANFTHIRRAMRGKDKVGGMEARTLLGNAYVWKKGADEKRLRKALRWVATETATPTGLLGAAWQVFPHNKRGKITPMVAQPDAWHGAMFYLAALKTYGGAPWRD